MTGSSRGQRARALAVVMLGTFMAPLDGTIGNVAVTNIGRAFGKPLDLIEWVLLSYLLVIATFLVPFGRLGDLIGHKRVYVAGFIVFGAGSLASGLAPGLWWLVAARVLQGVGAAMLQSVNGALVIETFPANMRGRALGINGAAVAIGLALGPFLGGFLLTTLGWRWIFFVNIPVAIAGTYFAERVLPRSPTREERFDLPGAAMLGAALFAFTLALSRAHVWGWGSPQVVTLIVAALAVGAWFVRFETRTIEPTLDLSMFENRIFAVSVGAAVCAYLCQYEVFFTVPLVLQSALGETALAAGSVLVPMAAVVVVAAPVMGSLSDRVNARYLTSAGMLLIAIGAFGLSALPPVPGVPAIVGCLLVIGLGIGCFNQPNNATIMANVAPSRTGVAAATLALARNVGIALGISCAGAIYFFAAAHLAPAAHHTIAAARPVFLSVVALALATAAVSYVRGRSATAVMREGPEPA